MLSHTMSLPAKKQSKCFGLHNGHPNLSSQSAVTYHIKTKISKTYSVKITSEKCTDVPPRIKKNNDVLDGGIVQDCEE